MRRTLFQLLLSKEFIWGLWWGCNVLLFKILSRNNFKDRQKLSYVIPSNYYGTVPVREFWGGIELTLFSLVKSRLRDDQRAAYNCWKDKHHSTGILGGVRGYNKWLWSHIAAWEVQIGHYEEYLG